MLIPLPHITPDKASDPETGTELLVGDVITYVLSWTNTGEAVGQVQSTDDLSGILDDAVLTEGPTVVEGEVSAELTDAGPRVEGDLAPGATAAVSYTVTVLPDGERGDDATPSDDGVCRADRLALSTGRGQPACTVTNGESGGSHQVGPGNEDYRL